MIVLGTLGWILAQARAEAQLQPNEALFKSLRANAIRILNRVQNDVWTAKRWSTLVGNYDKTLAAGQTLYDFPTGMGPINLFTAYTKWGDVWTPVARGLDQEIVRGMDPELNQRSDPVLRWDIRASGQFEVWPEPATNGTIMRFSALAQPVDFVNDADVSTIDRYVLALYLAAELTKDAQLAKLKLAQADARAARLAGHLTRSGRRIFVLGGEDMGLTDGRRQQPPLVAQGGTP